METVTAPSTARVALKWGCITGLVLLVYHILQYITQLETNTLLNVLSFVFLITGFVLAMKDFRSLNGGVMRYGQGFGLGMLMAVIIGILLGFGDSIYKHQIDNSVLQRELAHTQERLESSEFFSDSAIDKMIEEASRTTAGQTFIGTLFAYIILSFFLILIIAAIMKKDRDILEV